MLRNYLKIALRSILAQKGYSAINIFGLATGIACTLLIGIYIFNEFSYDRFHSNAKNIYRICLDGKLQETEIKGPLSCAPIGATAVNNYPDILRSARIYNLIEQPTVHINNKSFTEKSFIFADSSFFQVFDGFRLINGSPNNILKKAYQLVITEETAQRYFGSEEALGKTVLLNTDKQPWKIVGIVENPPSNSHIKFDLIGSFASHPISSSTMWLGNSIYTYLLLKDGLSISEVNKRLGEMVATYAGPQFQQYIGMDIKDFDAKGNRYNYFLQPLVDIHLKSDMPFELENGGNLIMVYVFAAISIFILVVAAINFINLATARMARRAKEVGIRKVVGASIPKLISQFLTESILITTVSVMLSLFLILFSLPIFYSITGKVISLNSIPLSISIGFVIAIILFVGCVAGGYPAFFLAKLTPLSVLKGKIVTGLKNKSMRFVLVTFQFVFTIGLFVSTFMVYKQVSYLQVKDLGYKPEKTLVIKGSSTISNVQRNSLFNEITKQAHVIAVAGSSSLPTTEISNTVMQRDDVDKNDIHSFNYLYADQNFIETIGFQMVEGRYFNPKYASDSIGIILNQSAIKTFGFKESPIGHIIRINDTEPRVIIGVAKDFHYESLHKKINPLAIIYREDTDYITIKFDGNISQQTIQKINAIWDEFIPNQTFEFFFLDDAIKNQYKSEKRTALLFSIFSIIAIIIALLGLIGLSSYSTEQRTKEIGIRKVLGADSNQIVWLLLSEINRIFVISTLITLPITWYFINKWLENFSFRINYSPSVFISAVVITYTFAIITVAYQTIKAANANPIKSLKYE